MRNLINKKIIKRLTIIDYLVFLVLLMVISIALLYFSREKKVVYVFTVNEYPEWQENPFPPLYWVSNSIKAGDEAYSSTGSRIAEVVEVKNTEWGGQRRYSRLKLRVYTLYDNRTKQYRIGDQTLRVGDNISLSIGNTKYEGVISYVGDSLEPPGYQNQKLEVVIKTYEVPPWLAATYDESFKVKDTQGEEIFTIVSSTIVPAEKSVETDSGAIVRSRDPYFKDVIITARIEVRCQESICYYNETFPVKIGHFFWAQSEKSVIGIVKDSARVISIRELENE